jgi:mono/diheme cytochrome c family protein
VQGANLALGEKIYRGGKKETGVTACIACHGPTGQGIPSAGFPALAMSFIDLQPQVMKITSYLPMVGGSLQVLRLLPPLKLVAMI